MIHHVQTNVCTYYVHAYIYIPQEYLRSAVEQRAVRDVCVPRNPATIGRAEVHVSLLVVKSVLQHV